MFYLRKYTGGEAQSAIEALFLSPSQTSYDAAIDILQTRFGSPTVVTEAFRKRLDIWPKIKETDSKSLQRLSDFLACLCGQEIVSIIKIFRRRVCK